MKKLMLRAMMLCMVLCLLPSNVYGASAFEFRYLNDDPSTNHRTGIKSIVIDDKTYFDIYDGNPDGRTPPNNSFQFLKDILTKPDNSPNGGGATALDYWSQLAYRIFADNSSYTSYINPGYGGSFEQAFGRRGGSTDGGYADLVQDLSNINSGARWNTGGDSDDNTRWTGLAYANSLKDLRQRMANSISTGIGRKTSGDSVLSATDSGNGLKMLDVDYKGDVLYSMVTGVDKRGNPASWFYYNSFGLAFYDFQMSVIADNGLQYITAAEGYDSVRDAADNMEPGVTYEEIGNTSGVLSYYENGASVPSDVGMQFSQSNSTEIANSMTTTETYTFRETIGSETKFKATVPLLAEIEQTIKLEFSAEQAFSTAWTETKTVKQETTNTVSASLNLPAHSAAAIDSADGTVKVTLRYDCPIALTYKVAIFSLSGCCYDDNIATRSFSTAGYWQKHFCTIFGNSTGDAQSEFYDRAVTFSKVDGYDETNGSTYGWGKSRTAGTTAITVNKLNWGSIIGNVQPERLNVDYSRECYTVEPVKTGVDADGNDILVYVQKSPLEQLYADTRTDGVARYDNQVGAPASIGALANYTLVTGDVYERVGAGLEPVDNDFPDVGSTKVVYFYDNPAENVVKFYYVLTADAIPDPPPAPDSNSTFNALSVTFSTMVSKETLANWLGKHVPMSSAGGVLTYMSRSMSTKINSILPLYPLKNIKLKEGVATEYSMIEGDVLEVNGLDVDGFNGSMVPYFGFSKQFGHWELVGGNSDVASLETNPLTGRTTLTAGDEEGKVYLKYVIDENRYTAHEIPLGAPKFATNADLASTAYVEINVSVKPFAGRISATGRIIGYVGDSVNLLDSASGVRIHVFDSNDLEISAPVTWQKQYLDGLTITGSNLSFDAVSPESEDFAIRAYYRDKWSDWVPVKVLAARALNRIDISDDTDPPVLADYILDDGFNTFELGWLTVAAQDQYDEPWLLDPSDIVWYYDNGNGPVALPGSTLTVAEPGTYLIWAESGGVASNKLTLDVAPARVLHDLFISDGIGLLDEYILNDGTDTFNLGLLDVSALDQYGAPFAITAGDLKWYYNIDGGPAVELSSSTLVVTEPGAYAIWAESGGVASNELDLLVKDAAVVVDITIAGDIPALNVNPDFHNHTFNLSGLTATALDQYDRSIAIPADAVWVVTEGDLYASIAGSVISGNVQGEGKVRLEYGDVKSNELPFSVKTLPFAFELFQSELSDYVIEGMPYDLLAVALTAKDKWGEAYAITEAEIASLVWEMSLIAPGTLADSDITLAGSTLTVAEGAVEYAGTGTVVLSATLPDSGDGTPSSALVVYLEVRQAPIPAELTIGLADENAVLREGENRLVSEFFTVSAIDQYGEDYPLTTADVIWDSDNDSAFQFENNAVIKAVTEGESANITASIDIVKYGTDPDDYKITEAATIASNEIQLTVPKPRRVDSISLNGVPLAVPFGSTFNVGNAVYTVYDEDGVPFTDAELAEYPAMVVYSIGPIDGLDENSVPYVIKTTFNSSTGQVSFSAGLDPEIVKLVAMVVNSTTGDIIETSVNIKVGPFINTFTPPAADFEYRGGSQTFTLIGENLIDGITVTAFDSNGNSVDSVSGTTEGSETQQTVTLNFPANSDTENSVVYTVKYSVNGTKYDNALTATVTVDKDSSGEPSIKTLAPATTNLSYIGGTQEFTLTGVNLPDGITLSAFDSNGNKIDSISETMVGSDTQQKVTLSFPRNTSTTSNVAYTVKCSFDDIDYYDSPTATVIVARDSSRDSVNPVGGGGGGAPRTIEEPTTPLAPLNSFAAFIEGFEDNTFRGTQMITREQFVTILFRLKNAAPLPAADPDKPAFGDVAPDRWSYDAIEWAFEAGIAEADEDGNFCPADPLARADMAVMFVKAENLTEMAENTFSDLDGHPAADDILKAVHAGIFEGYPDGTFDPNGSTNRYEAVTALVRYLLGGEPTDDMWQSLSITFTDVPSSHWAYKYVVLAVNGYVGVPK